MTDHDDLEVERLLRASLDTHAAEVDTGVPVAARARAAARRHRGRWIAAGAAVAVAAVAVTAVALERPDPPSTEKPPVAGPTSSAAAVPAGWRTEYWHDVSVQVPADWGWGAGPTDRSRARCGGPVDRTTPYVGRPIMLSDLCIIERSPAPEAPYVWFDGQVEPGIVDLDNGYTQESVEVAGTMVTVGTDDAELRSRILGSAAVGGPCAPSLSAPPVASGALGDRELDDSLVVCAYRSEDDGSFGLVYGDVLGAAAARATEALVRPAPVLTGDCLSPEGGEWVTLTADLDAGWSGTYVVDLNCPAVTDSLGQMHRLEPAMVRPWAVHGLPLTLYGPSGGKGAGFGSFIGMLG